MVGKILEPEIRSLIDARNFGALREVFREWPPADVAEVILDVPEDEQVIIFRVLPHALAADVFEYLDLDAQQKLLRAMAHEQVVGILNEMSPDDRTALLEELPSAAARQLIRLLTPEERHVAQSLLGYPEGSVGRLMTPDFIAVNEDWTVQQVLDYVREHGQDSETLNVIYVVDERGKLIDDIRIREFLLKPLAHTVRDLMEKTFVTLNVHDSQQDALNVFRKYDRTALPVVDSTGVLVGIVTIDDMLDVAEEEATEDIQKFGGMEALDEPYMRIPLWRMVRKRAGWACVGRDPGNDRHCARGRMGDRRRTIFPSTAVRRALAPRRAHCRHRTRRRRALGNTFRVHASLYPAESRSRPGSIFCPFCRHPC